MRKIALFVLALLGLSRVGFGVEVQDLRVEGLEAPIGIGTAKPRFGWAMADDRRGAKQSAYQVLVAREPDDLKAGGTLLWDSGKVSGDQSQWIDYAGKPLHSAERLWWTIRIWDQAGEPSEYAKPAAFETGLLQLSDWKAKWIADPKPLLAQDPLVKTWTENAAEVGKEREKTLDLLWSHYPAPPQFRKEFDVPGKILRARLYLAVRGFAVPYLNGKRVGDRIMDPSFLPYDYHAHYVVHDVTGQMREGKNAIGILLGGGWHGIGGSHSISFVLTKRTREEAFAAELRVWTDKGEFVVASDGTWKVADGPLLKSVFFVGECYDARRETPGWNEVRFDDSPWRAAAEVEPGSPRLLPMLSSPERVVRSLKPVKKSSPYPGVWIYDFGELFSGRTRLNLSGVPKDTVIVQRYAQWLDKASGARAWYPWPDIGAKATGPLPNDANGAHGGNTPTDAVYVYRSAGRAAEEWAPEFDYQSMRFVEVIGYPGEPPDDLLSGEVIHSDFPRVGSVETSSEPLNRMHRFLIETLRQTTHGIQQDNNCQEREQGTTLWNTFVLPFLMFEHDYYQYQLKALDGLRENSYQGITGIMYHDVARNPPGPNRKPEDLGSSAANVHAPWLAWLYYGDPKVLKDHYETSVAFVNSFEKPFFADEYYGWGDWSDVNANADGKRPITPDLKHAGGILFKKVRAGEIKADSSDNWPPLPLNTPIGLSDGQYFASAVDHLADIAGVLGKTDDAKRYRDLLARIKKQLDDTYYDSKNKTYGSQAGDAYAVANNLEPSGDRQAVIDALREDFTVKNKGHLTTGWLGSYVPGVLCEGGYADDAMKVFTATDYPSFGQICFTFGMNTMSARWPMKSDQPNLARMIQGEKAGVGRWYYEGLGGIIPHPAHPGFKKFILSPSLPKDLEWAKVSYRSLYGEIASDWKKEGGDLKWNVRIPPNTSAEIRVPMGKGQSIEESGRTIWKNGKVDEMASGLKFVRFENGWAIFEAAAGRYEFRIQ